MQNALNAPIHHHHIKHSRIFSDSHLPSVPAFLEMGCKVCISRQRLEMKQSVAMDAEKPKSDNKIKI